MLKRDQAIADFRVDHLYSDSDGAIAGVKLIHLPTGAPVFILQLETVPEVLTWVDDPTDSNKGLPHSLEHLLANKGVKGRYFKLLRYTKLGQGNAATFRDSVAYGLSSGAGVNVFFEQFHALLESLYRPDFSDIEAEREFYHFAVADDGPARKTLIEGGTVYDEMLANQYRYRYIYELSKRVLGDQSPFAFDTGGAPDEMRGVTPEEIRVFHEKYYHLGPGTGFIFTFPRQENLRGLLQRISHEFQQFSKSGFTSQQRESLNGPKYPIHPSQDFEPAIFPYPGANEAGAGFVHLSWRPSRTDSLLNLTLLKVFSWAIAGGDQSLLYKTIVDRKQRTVDSGATGVDSELFVDNSSRYPVVVLEISGIPGNQLSTERLDQLRSLIVGKIREISEYPDQSQGLLEFNQVVAAYAKGLQRSEAVWTKDAPGFDAVIPDMRWKTHLENLELDDSFVRSLSGNREWQLIDEQLKSGRNLWRNLVQEFHLLDIPYITATAPSPKVLEDVEKRRQERVKNKIADLMRQHHASDEQEALSHFEQDELVKSKEIDKIDARVPRPDFTDHPPLVPDDQVRSSQFKIRDVPVIASVFDRPPTIDIGLSFDMRKVPRKYYKYLPLIAECFDSLGLKSGGKVVPYAELLSKLQHDVVAFSTGYAVNPASRRMEFIMRASALNVHEFHETLQLIHQLMEFNYLDPANANRLLDIAARHVSTDNLYAKQDTSTVNSAYSFHYQNDELLLSLHSRFTRAHWNSRSKWLLHEPVPPEAIEGLDNFAKVFLSSISGMSKQQITKKLDELNVKGIERELAEYWRGNLSSFAGAELEEGLRQLTVEVQADLRTGPTKTIEDLRALQKIILNRRALHIDFTVGQQDLGKVRRELDDFVETIPSFEQEVASEGIDNSHFPMISKLEKRYGLSQKSSPWYVGFVNPDRSGGDVISYADFPGYAQLDRKSLVRVLASKLFAGSAPQSLSTKSSAAGLAYNNYVRSDPAFRLIWYYANKSPDIASLLRLVNSTVSTASDLHDPALVDHVLSQTFSFSRSMRSFSERGKAAAQDIRDGNEPEKVRRFSEAILQLRKDPALLSELTNNGVAAICGVLMRDDCKEQQEADRSLFFFVGSEQLLADVEKRLSMPKLLRLYPSDFWIQ